MIEVYRSLVKYIENSRIRDKVVFSFIDVLRDRIEDYPDALDLIRKRYALPYVAVNGVIKFCDRIDYELIYQEAEKCLK
jgi:hypothetical protein